MKYSLLIVFVFVAQSLFAQLVFTDPIPKYGCPNTTHSITIGVKNNSGIPVPTGTAITATVTIKDNTNTTVLGTTTQTIYTTSATTTYVTIPTVAFVGPMECNVSGSASFTLFGTPYTYPITSTYTVQYPPNLTISENPAGTIEVSTPLDGYSVRYYANANYTTVIKETTLASYTAEAGASYTAKAYDSKSTCISVNASNAVAILVTPTISFPALAPQQIGAADFSPGASSTSTATAITYTSSNTAVATIVSDKIHIVGAGTAVITASQAAVDQYNLAADDVTQTLTVNNVPTGVNNVLQASVSTYPNPASEYVVVKLENTSASEAVGTLTDAMGAEITRVNFSQGSNSLEANIHVHTLTAGMYVLRIQSDKGMTSTKIFIK